MAVEVNEDYLELCYDRSVRRGWAEFGRRVRIYERNGLQTTVSQRNKHVPRVLDHGVDADLRRLLEPFRNAPYDI